MMKDDKDYVGVTMVSHALSWVFSPVLTPTYGILAVFAFTPLHYLPTPTMVKLTLLVFVVTGVLPMLAVYLLTRFGSVSDHALTRRQDRLYPYIIMFAALICTGFYLYAINAPLWVCRFYWGASAACAINFVVNFWWKISAHGAGMGGLTALLVILTRYALPHTGMLGWILAVVVLTGMLGSARVWLGRHTAMQTICGTASGFLCVLAAECIG